MNLFNATYDSNTKTLHGTHVSGFYSCINCVRISLYKLISQNIIPTAISFQHTLSWYKDDQYLDYYPVLYKTNYDNFKNLITNFNFEIFCPTQLPHNEINFSVINPIENTFFTPSNVIIERVNTLKEKYNVNYDNTLAVLHRGNDKWKEAKLSPIEEWIDTIESKYINGMKILIQTDEEAFKEKFLDHFGDRCFVFNEMLFDNIKENNVRPSNNKLEWAINFESVMRIISKCKYIINHTGNCALIPIVYRGNTKGETQIFNRQIKNYDS